MTALENKSILQNSLLDCTLNNIMFLWRTVMAKVALNHTDVCISFFFFFWMGELATLSVVCLAMTKKVYRLGLCMPDSTVSYLSPSWLTNLSREQFQFILSSSVCCASNRSIFNFLSSFLSSFIPLIEIGFT